MHIAELSLHLLGAQVWPVVVPTPRNPHPVPVRSTGASEALGGLAPAIRAMSARGPIVDVTLEGLMHAKDTSAILQAGARILPIGNEHPEALERLCRDPALEPEVRTAARLLRGAAATTVTSPTGTALQADLRGASTVGIQGWTSKPGTLAHWRGSLVVAFPASGTARGRLVLASGDPNLAFKRYVESPATLVIEQDYVTAVQDADAARFRDDPRRIG